MAKTYLVTCQYKGKDFKDFYTDEELSITVVYPPETFDVLANAKPPILPYSDLAIMKVVEMTEAP